MKVPRADLTQVIAQRLKTGGKKRLAEDVAAYLISERRVSELSSLRRDLEQYRTDTEQIVEVTAVSAFSVSDTVKSDIRQLIKHVYPAAKQIIIDERLEANVVGGVRLELANQQLDLTVRGKLSQFKQLTTQDN